jgi:murein DD-endopeptidase MepM/ murein hydrolase activator NlpD
LSILIDSKHRPTEASALAMLAVLRLSSDKDRFWAEFLFDTAGKKVYLLTTFAMALRLNTCGEMFSGKHPVYSLPRVFKNLTWLWVLSFIFVLKPIHAHATRQQTLRKETARGKPTVPTPPIRRLTKGQNLKGLAPQRETNSFDAAEKREYVVQRTKAGDTLHELVGRFALSKTEKQLWARSIQRIIGLRKLPAGKEVHFYFSKASSGSTGRNRPVQLEALELDYSDASILTWEKSARGILFQDREKPYDIELKTAGASVESSLFEDGQKAGVHPTLLSQLADIFTWDIDLEIRKGDSFKILYEQRSRHGQGAKVSLRILAAELNSAGQTLTAIYFEKQKGQGNYYSLDGRSLARSFLRFPLEFTSITSHFAHTRFHPLRKVNLPHTGVDFAAQRGTPVRAVGDGVIALADWSGPYGKTVEIQHNSTYTTRYAHLEKFADGIRAGTSISKGQVIGYVGSTGRTTGPHLHFELYKDQQYVDPLSVDFPAEDLIEPALQRVFDNQKEIFLVELSSAPQS